MAEERGGVVKHEELLQHELTDVPLSLASADVSLRPTDKAVLEHTHFKDHMPRITITV